MRLITSLFIFSIYVSLLYTNDDYYDYMITDDNFLNVTSDLAGCVIGHTDELIRLNLSPCFYLKYFEVKIRPDCSSNLQLKFDIHYNVTSKSNESEVSEVNEEIHAEIHAYLTRDGEIRSQSGDLECSRTKMYVFIIFIID